MLGGVFGTNILGVKSLVVGAQPLAPAATVGLALRVNAQACGGDGGATSTRGAVRT